MYAFLPLGLIAIWGMPSIAFVGGIADDGVATIAFVGATAWFALWIAYSLSDWSKCWRCGHSVSRRRTWHYPIVSWTHCANCGVRHSVTPEQVRANPMAHLKPGDR